MILGYSDFFNGSILEGIQHIQGDPYLNGTIVLLDDDDTQKPNIKLTLEKNSLMNSRIPELTYHTTFNQDQADKQLF